MGFIGLIKIFDLILDPSYRVWLMTSTSTEAGLMAPAGSDVHRMSE